MRNVLISAREICRAFDGDGGKNVVLDRVSVDIFEGDFTIIMGSSGAGKSTLLYALSGMDHITAGTIFYKGTEINSRSERQMAALRSREFGFVFQQNHLVSSLTLLENVTVAGYLNRDQKAGSVREKAERLLERMNVGEARNRLPSLVSGGEAQRAALARAVINDPALIFCDEPTGALNRRNTDGVLDLLTDLNRGGQSILMVTHDVRAALRGNRILYLEDGAVIGEKGLPPYGPEDGRDREEQVNAWLTSMEWRCGDGMDHSA